jgi:hypothetical protein
VILTMINRLKNVKSQLREKLINGVNNKGGMMILVSNVEHLRVIAS